MKRVILSSLAFLLWISDASAVLRQKTIEYKQGDVVLEGSLAYDDAAGGKKPGILIVDAWYGLTDYAKSKAEALAQMGYVAFAADIYGKGVRAKSNEEAAKLSNVFKSDRSLTRARVRAGLEALKKQPQVDIRRIGAMGYCFGGMCVLELARSGAEVAGVVSFHGSLDTPHAEDAKNIRGRVLALHGADDPFVSQEQVDQFQEEMKKGGVDWQLVLYGGAVHAFTDPRAGQDPSKGMAYNEKADRRSWQAMQDFFKEVLR